MSVLAQSGGEIDHARQALGQTEAGPVRACRRGAVVGIAIAGR